MFKNYKSFSIVGFILMPVLSLAGSITAQINAPNNPKLTEAERREANNIATQFTLRFGSSYRINVLKHTTQEKIMFKKYLTLVLTILVVNLFLSAAVFADTKEEKTARFAEKVKTTIVKLGTGKDARVEVKLKDGTKLKGYVSQINENSFAVTDEQTGRATEIPYPNAKQVKSSNLSNGVKVAIAVGILAAVGLFAIYAKGK